MTAVQPLNSDDGVNTKSDGGGNTNINFAPVMQQSTTVVVNQVVPVRIGQRQNERPWSTGLCGCFEDCGSCCCAYFCYQEFVCGLASKMDECCCGPCWFSYLGAGHFGPTPVPNPFLVGMRGRLRGQYGISGSVCNDVLAIWCCEFCATTQMYRELKHWQNQ